MRADDDIQATRRVVAEHLERALSLVRTRLRDRRYRGDVDEAAHGAACTAWRGPADLRDLERLDAWFGRILVNACRDRLRRRKVRPLAVDLPDGVEARDRTADIDRDGAGGRRPCAHVPRNSRGTPLIAVEP